MQKQVFQTIFAVAVTVLSAAFTAQPLRAQAAAASKTAGEVYKNIVQLKGMPTDQLMPAMQFMSSSLGVECAFCHVAGKMEADDKGAKKTTREMIAMQAAINKDSFRGQLQVTCNWPRKESLLMAACMAIISRVVFLAPLSSASILPAT